MLKGYGAVIGNVIERECTFEDGRHTKIGDSTVNQELIEDCRRKAGNPDLDAAEASKVIIEAIWEKVRETHRLRVAK